jgi:hypothetical protein
MTDAEKCRENGWVVGTVLEGDEGYGPERILLTAIGERSIMARRVTNNKGETVSDRETTWTLSCRNWKKVGFISSVSKEAFQDGFRELLKPVFLSMHRNGIHRIEITKDGANCNVQMRLDDIPQKPQDQINAD